MADSTEVATVEAGAIAHHPGGALSPSDVVRQVALVQQVMAEVMHEGEHFGKIPGCGDKPALLQPGAQILALTFRLAPQFDVRATDLPGGHREFYVETRLFSAVTGQQVGMGVGIASTREAKYLYRTGPVEYTGEPVPAEYWNLRQEDPAAARKLLGRGRQTRKNPDTGGWEIVVAGERVETDNPADAYNTVLKMATKRSFVHAVLNTTAASDMFTQDIEELQGHEALAAPAPRVDAATLATLHEARDALGVTPNVYADQVAHFGATVDTALTQEAAERLIAAYQRKGDTNAAG